MAALTPPFSKTELLDELRVTLVVFAREIGRAYTFTGAFRLLGLEPPADEDEPYADPFVTAQVDPAQSIDLGSLWITRNAEALYDFAFEGRHAEGLDWSVVCEDLYPFLRSVEVHEVVVEEAGMPRRLRHVIELGVARAAVNGDCDELIPIRAPERDEHEQRFGGYLPLRQVALLAGVDEKTVRNAATSAKAPLKSKSIGGRAYFAIDDVREWLDKRGQLLPTVMVKSSASRDLKAQPFTSAEDLALFLEDRRATVGVEWGATDASGQRRIPELALAWAAPAPPMGSPSFDLEAALALADALQLPAGEFVPAVLALFQKIEQERVRAELRARLEGEKQ